MAALPTRKAVLFTARWLLGIGILLYLAWSLELKGVFEALATADFRWLAAGLALTVAIRALNGMQLVVAMQHLSMPLTVYGAFKINTIAAFYSLFLPGQLAAGAIKWYKLTAVTGKKAEVFATVLFLRLLNSCFILLFGFLAILADDSLGLGGLPWVGLLLALGLVAFMFLISTRQFIAILDPPEHDLSPSVVSGFRSGLVKISKAFRRYRNLSRGQLLKLLAIPLVAQLLSASVFLAAARALSLDIPYVSLLWLVTLLYFISLIPVTISGLGIREGALLVLLPRYGVEPADALAFSLVLFGFTLAIGLLGGIFEAKGTLLTAAESDNEHPGSKNAGQ